MAVTLTFVRLCPGCLRPLMEESEFRLLAARASELDSRYAIELFSDRVKRTLAARAYEFIPYRLSRREFEGSELVLFGLCEECSARLDRREEGFASSIARNLALLVAGDSPAKDRLSPPESATVRVAAR
ncbi:MAG: hypothetical protein QXU97_03810 [Fervidicoccaceae archaeon]